MLLNVADLDRRPNVADQILMVDLDRDQNHDSMMSCLYLAFCLLKQKKGPPNW
jgi:hypothetical protein